MHSKSHKIEIMINHKADEIINELLQSRTSRYQIGLETLMKGSKFLFNCVSLLCYKCHKINPNCGGSYIDSPGWIKQK